MHSLEKVRHRVFSCHERKLKNHLKAQWHRFPHYKQHVDTYILHRFFKGYLNDGLDCFKNTGATLCTVDDTLRTVRFVHHNPLRS
jgi:hypothetical protein